MLRPYPSLAMNAVGDANQLQSVVGVEIDPFNRLWILDQGRVGITAPAIDRSCKLVVWDVLLNMEVTRHHFPRHIAPPDTAFLSAIVLDQPRGFAYISDSGYAMQPSDLPDLNAGIIVYNFNALTDSARSWRLLSRHYSVRPELGFTFKVNGVQALPTAPLMIGVNGIALTPDGLFLYYSATSSRELYMIPTCILRANASETIVESAVIHALTKPGASDGMAFAYGTGPAPNPQPLVNGEICPREELPHGSADTQYELLISDLEVRR